MKQPELDAGIVIPALAANIAKRNGLSGALKAAAPQLRNVAQRFRSRIRHGNRPAAESIGDRFANIVSGLTLVVGAAVAPVASANTSPAPEAKFAPQGDVHVAGAGARGAVIGRYTRSPKLTPSPGG